MAFSALYPLPNRASLNSSSSSPLDFRILPIPFPHWRRKLVIGIGIEGMDLSGSKFLQNHVDLLWALFWGFFLFVILAVTASYSYLTNKRLSLSQGMSSSSTSLASAEEEIRQDNIEQLELLSGVHDHYGGVIVEMKDPIDPKEFGSLLRASLSQWRQLGKRGIWIKLPIELANLVEVVVKEGFVFHHAEPNYLMLVRWISETTNSLPHNASHRVGIGAFVMNTNREVLVVQEIGGKFKGSGVWKLPTGVVNEGEDICEAAIREVKEETDIDAEFVEVLAFRQSHNSFFTKSDLFFVCMLRPSSYDIQKQASEIEAAKWMPIDEYADQPFVRANSAFDYVAKVCVAKANNDYTGLSANPTFSSSGKLSYLYSKLKI